MSKPTIFIGYSDPKSEISQAIQSAIANESLSIITSALNGPDSSLQHTKPPMNESFIYAAKHGLASDDDRLREWGRLSAWAQTKYTDLLNQATQSYNKQRLDLDRAATQHDLAAIREASGIILEINSTSPLFTSLATLIGYACSRLPNKRIPILCITHWASLIHEHPILNGLSDSIQVIETLPGSINELKDRIREWLWSHNVYGLRLPKLDPELPCVFLAGPPGAGKSTLGKSLAKWLHVPHISTGETLRALPGDSHIRAGAQPFMDSGSLVPAHIMLQVVHHRLSQPDCKEGYILDGYPVDDANFQHCKSIGLVPTDVIILDMEEDLSVASQCVRSSRESDNPDNARERYRAYRKWMGSEPSRRFKQEFPTARLSVIQVDERQSPTEVLSAVMTQLLEYHIMHSPNWTPLTPELKEFQFALYSDCLVTVALNLHAAFPDVQFMVDRKNDNEITGYISGNKQSEKVAKYKDIREFAYQKAGANCGISLYWTLREASQSASKLTTTYEYPPVNATAAKLLTENDDITNLIINITMKWNTPKSTDYVPENIIESLEMLGACEISVISATTYPNSDKLKEQVTQIEFDTCNYDIKSFLDKSTFMKKIFKVLRAAPYKADEISYSIFQELCLA